MSRSPSSVRLMSGREIPTRARAISEGEQVEVGLMSQSRETPSRRAMYDIRGAHRDESSHVRTLRNTREPRTT